jgi:DNA repair exonuclease SbcCD ATPase subunit/DNA repair exonuclease SbcCD nuclease subunit
MISKIAHLADIHIRKVPVRNEEYEFVFKNLIKSLQKEKPDRIVIAGDLVHDYLDLQGEQLIMAHELLNELSKIAPVRITRGNHDCRKKNLKRVDSVRAIVKTLNNPNVIYYDDTDVFYDENIVWFVWHHGQVKNNPWKTKNGKIYEKLRSTSVTKDEQGKYTVPEYYAIDLFHDPVGGCMSTTGFEMKSKSYYKVSDFKGDFSFFGDIHRMQFLGETKAYCGSLIAQDVTEGDDNFHGYLLWDVQNKVSQLIPIHNEHSFKNIKITPYTDFDNLDYEISNPTKYMRIRFVWGTLPQTRNKDNERKLAEYFKSKYKNIIISHKNEFIESEKIEVNENVTLENISDKTVQQEIFKEYLEKIGTDKQLIDDIIALDEEITASITIDAVCNMEWNIVKFGGKNFMSYHELDVDWRDMDGLFQITGINTAGKTTIMKLISYILFGKTLETESRKQYGDSRFVNNRNNADFCEGYLVLEANGEYYGIKKKTEIKKSKSGEINGAPTTLSYYLLSTPDDEMNTETSLDKLDEDRRIKTQQKIDTIIGTYDNFMRIVMTTSDTLNRILSNDMAVFIDSLLYDSGLDIFDKKLESLKSYQKKLNEKTRVSCNVEMVTAQNATITQEITVLEGEINVYETKTIPEVQEKINIGRTYVETLTKKLFKIDPEIYGLNPEDVQKTIGIHTTNISDYKAREAVIEENIKSLKETYDAEKLKLFLEKKEEHKTGEYNARIDIKVSELDITNAEHQIEIINGEIFRLKQNGASKKKEALVLKDGKNAKNPICPTCQQEIVPDHLKHIDEKISGLEKEMFSIVDLINEKTANKTTPQNIIDARKQEIEGIKKQIQKDALAMEEILKEIGNLTNDKNDVEKRKELQNELNQIPTKVQNEQLKISILQQKIDNYNNSLLQIEENNKIEKGIIVAKQKLDILETEEQDYKEDVFVRKTSIGEKSAKIKGNNELITAFKEQEYRDLVMNLYKKCVHRDGIPRQILANYILPKINLTLENILSVAPFKVWLDVDDLKPKLAYNNRPEAVIDCISASGKERTFASVVLKFALNQINVKAKPMMFLLDEVMGKLSEESIEEFIEILQLIKRNTKKVLVVEHHCEINPDYLISVQLDEDGISSLLLE